MDIPRKSKIVNAVTIDRQTGDGRYSDILDVAAILADKEYGSAVNAIAVMVRQSSLFVKTSADISGSISASD